MTHTQDKPDPHVERAIELIRLCVIGRTNEAEMLLGLIPAEDIYALAGAAIVSAATISVHVSDTDVVADVLTTWQENNHA